MASKNIEALASSGIDVSTFEQILEMDDDDEREFSRGIVFGFLEQADTTFDEMQTAIEKKDLTELSKLGHFLKGSSATLGLTEMKNCCEAIQNLGSGKDATGETDKKPEFCLAAIKTELVKLREEFRFVRTALGEFYSETK